MSDANESLPISDDVHATDNNGQTEQDLLDAVLRNTEFLQDEPLPVKEVPEVDPVESEEDPESEEAVSEEVEEEVEEHEEEEVEGDAAEEAATESDIFSTDDLDLDAKVAVKIDGADTEVSFGDLIKGYSTEQSLSKKGRELGEARKALDEERAEKLGELDNIAAASNALLLTSEQALAKQYSDLEAQIDKARKEDDSFTLGELKDKREQVQKEYWGQRNKREQLQAAVVKQKQEQEAKVWQEQINHFHQEIPNLIPDFDEKIAENIRAFAIDEGINPDILNQITDPKIVKFVDDYRRLKTGVNKGVAKRKAIPTKKAVPTKKAKSPSTKAQNAEKMVKARAFKENASADDQMAFLRQHASRTLNLN